MAQFDTIRELLALPEGAGGQVANPRRSAVCLCVAVLVVAAGVGAAEVLCATGQPLADLAVRLLLSCVIAGVLEELLFRGGAFPLLIGVFDGNAHPVRRAALVQAAVFALLHLTGTVPEALTAIVLVQALAKVVQAMAFGLIMAAIYALTRNLAVPVAVHVAYNLLALFPRELFCGPTATYLTGDATEALIMGAAALVLAAIAVPAWRALR